QPPVPSNNPAKASAPDTAETTQLAATAVQTTTVTPDEAGMRVDRFLEARFAGLAFSHIQRVIRKGELRVNGRRGEPQRRLPGRAAGGTPPPPARRPPPPGRGGAGQKNN